MLIPLIKHTLIPQIASNAFMRTIVFLAVLFSFLLSINPTFIWAKTPTKRAIIVAISEYAPGTGWRKINTLNDIEVVRKGLRSQEFLQEDILVLKESYATKANIQKAFQTHFASLQKGDFAYFHFSGHGQQLPDRNLDELDGKDEALVPYDACEKYDPQGYQGENHLTDDELQEMLNLLRKKLGPTGQVLVTLDACHSGTATRTLNKLGSTRGSVRLMGSENDQKLLNNQTKDIALFHESDNVEDPMLAPLVLFTATLQNELNHEVLPKGQDERFGPLSYAFGKAISSFKGKMTYEALYDEIKIIMAGFHKPQSPSAEGNLRQVIFDGDLKGGVAHYKVIKENADFIDINAGSFAGLLPGTEIGFYPRDTWHPSPNKLLIKGTITHSNLFTSRIKVEGGKQNLKNAWAFVETLHFGNLEIGIKLDIEQELFLQEIKKSIGEVVNFKITSTNPQLIIWQRSGKPIEIFTTNDVDLTPKNLSKQPRKKQANFILDKVLLPFAQAQYLRDFSYKDEYMNVDMNLELVKIEHGKYVKANLNSKLNECGNIELTVGDLIRINVTNNGDTGVYINIYDIQPNGKVNTLIPYSNHTREEYYLKPNETKNWNHRWTIGPPDGVEVFKLIALNIPADILQNDKNGKNLVISNPPAKGKNRKTNYFKNNVSPNTVFVQELVFLIQKK